MTTRSGKPKTPGMPAYLQAALLYRSRDSEAPSQHAMTSSSKKQAETPGMPAYLQAALLYRSRVATAPSQYPITSPAKKTLTPNASEKRSDRSSRFLTLLLELRVNGGQWALHTIRKINTKTCAARTLDCAAQSNDHSDPRMTTNPIGPATKLPVGTTSTKGMTHEPIAF